MKKLLIYGVRYSDIVLYLARILTNLNKRVIVIDRSVSKPLRYFLPVDDEFDLDHDVFGYCGFGYTYNSLPAKGRSGKELCPGRQAYAEACETVSAKDTEKMKESIKRDEEDEAFDIVIVLNDASAIVNDYWDEAVSQRSVRLFITDEFPDNLNEMRIAFRAMNKTVKMIEELYGDKRDRDISINKLPDGKCFFAVRDYTGSLRLIIDELVENGGAAKNYMIPYASKDRQLEVLAACNDGFRFMGASVRLMGLIEDLLEELGVNTWGRDFQTAYIAAGKGRSKGSYQMRYRPPSARYAKK